MDRHGAFAQRLVDLLRAQHVRPTEDGIEWRPQLVRHRRQELILQPVAFLGMTRARHARARAALDALLRAASAPRRWPQAVLLRRQRVLRLARERQRVARLLMEPARFGGVAIAIF